MKYIILFFILVADTLAAQAQQKDIIEILNKIKVAVKNTPEGQYTFYNDYSREAPSTPRTHYEDVSTCSFKMNKQDTVIGYKLSISRNDSTFHKIYNGTAIIEMSFNKMVTITDARKYPREVKYLLTDFSYPFIAFANIFLQKYNSDSLISKIQLLPDEIINGEKCWKLAPQINESGNKRIKMCYYINKTSFLPVKAIIELTETIGNVTETAVSTSIMEAFKKTAVPDSIFTLNAMHGYSAVRQFNGEAKGVVSDLLSRGSEAPSWKLPGKGGDSISLTDFKGKIVVMDFWYKACLPCYYQMLDIQQLKAQVKRADVVFIGVNGIDDPVHDQLDKFLEERKLDIASVYNGKTIAADYKVSAYPVLYVIGKDGKVLFTQDGYSNSLKADILQLLESQ